jgi:hypothetical protein
MLCKVTATDVMLCCVVMCACAAADLLHGPMLGSQSSPAAQAAFFARQQQLLQMQQKMQLHAAAQQKMLSNLQQCQQQQAANLRMQAQLQAHAQALPNIFQSMQLSDVGTGNQQDTMLGMAGQAAAAQAQQQQMLFLNGFNSPVSMSMSPAQVAMNSGSIALSLAGAGVSATGSSSSGNMASMSGLHASYSMLGGQNSAPAMCSPSPIDVQYVPFFCSANSAPMASALMLQDSMGLQPSSLHMFSPSCGAIAKPANASAPQQQLFASDILNSSGNAVDSTVGGACMAGGAMPPAAFCSDPLLQGMGALSGLGSNTF